MKLLEGSSCVSSSGQKANDLPSCSSTCPIALVHIWNYSLEVQNSSSRKSPSKCPRRSQCKLRSASATSSPPAADYRFSFLHVYLLYTNSHIYVGDEIYRNIKGPSELKLSLTVSPSLLTSELKAKINEQTQIEPERQRLIYSGKVRLLHQNGRRNETTLIRQTMIRRS